MLRAEYAEKKSRIGQALVTARACRRFVRVILRVRCMLCMSAFNCSGYTGDYCRQFVQSDHDKNTFKFVTSFTLDAAQIAHCLVMDDQGFIT